MDTWKTGLNDEFRMKEFFECETPCQYKIKVSLLGFNPALWILDRYYAYSLVCRSRILSWLFSSNTCNVLFPSLVLLGLIGGEILIISSFSFGGFGLECVPLVVQYCTLLFMVYSMQLTNGCMRLTAA